MAKKKTTKPALCPTAPTSCCPMSGKILLVVVALLFMATDLGWITWWKINWWTAAFILVALYKLFMHKCD